MGEKNQVIPFATRLRKPSSALKPAGHEDAKKAAQMILSSYPDFGKASPEYIVNIIDVLATYPAFVLPKMCDLREGIPARCKYLPSVADIVQYGDHLIAQREKADEEAAADRKRNEEAEKRAEYFAERLQVLEKARKKYKTAYMTPEGEIKYYPDLEKAEVIDFKTARNGAYTFAIPEEIQGRL